MSAPITAFAHYRVKPGRTDEFLAVLDRHIEVLRDLGLVTGLPQQVYVGAEKDVEGPLIIEIFEWITGDASRRAHTEPRVREIWTAMGPLCEARGGRPPFEFPNLRRVV